MASTFGIIFCTILHHFLLKPKLEHAVGNEDAVLLQGNQFLVDEGFLDAVDIRLAAQRIGVGDILSGETRVDATAEKAQKIELIGG